MVFYSINVAHVHPFKARVQDIALFRRICMSAEDHIVTTAIYGHTAQSQQIALPIVAAEADIAAVKRLDSERTQVEHRLSPVLGIAETSVVDKNASC